ncbi:unnamed protein product [Leptosia nina]|uniref:Uncharacterized protein n=1 Tax=Leptosia nina TaxID=320188 RepID=A0AAV1J906_9NEOP
MLSIELNLPSLEKIDIVEFVQFNGELEGSLQVGHGVWGGARGAMPPPSARLGPRLGAARGTCAGDFISRREYACARVAPPRYCSPQQYARPAHLDRCVGSIALTPDCGKGHRAPLLYEKLKPLLDIKKILFI